MTKLIHKAFIAALGAVALMFAAGETFAASAGPHGTGAGASRGFAHPAAARAFRHHRRNFIGPIVGAPFYGPDVYGADGAPVDATLPASNDIRYTYSYDIPWDWAHRFPPNVVPSDRPYVSSCPAETVTVPGRYGTEQTVNITRCY